VRHFACSLALLAGAVAWPSLACAQQWRVGIDAGRIRSTLDPVAREAVSLAAGAGFEGPSSALRASVGIPSPGDSVRWAAIGGWKRLAGTKRGFTGGIDLSANAFGFRMPGSTAQPVRGGLLGPLRPGAPTGTTITGRALAGQVLPLIAYDAGAVQVQARAGMSYYGGSAGDADAERVSRLGDLQLVIRPAPAVALIPTVRHVAPRDEAGITFAGASGVVAAANGRVHLRGEAGRWIAGVNDSASGATAWALGTEVRVTRRASLTAAARRSGFDPLHLSPDQTSWSLGASIALGRRAPERVTPIATRDASGSATIRLPVSSTSSPPRVAGDFNGWAPAPMERDGTSWTYTLTAPPGVYNYAFVAPDGTWFVPENVPGRKADGMGGHVAVVVIR